jgi:alpha-tubulin suppressor-like RCC1 family protein
LIHHCWLTPTLALTHNTLITPTHRVHPFVSVVQPQLLEDAALASESVVKVAAGSRHSLLLCASGKAYACGWGSFGQLGTGRFASSRTPAAVAVPAGAKVVDVAAGWWHSLIVTE